MFITLDKLLLCVEILIHCCGLERRSRFKQQFHLSRDICIFNGHFFLKNLNFLNLDSFQIFRFNGFSVLKNFTVNSEKYILIKKQ
jgi:hypothetical protein